MIKVVIFYTLIKLYEVRYPEKKSLYDNQREIEWDDVEKATWQLQLYFTKHSII